MLKELTLVDLHFLEQIDIQRFHEFWNLFYSKHYTVCQIMQSSISIEEQERAAQWWTVREHSPARRGPLWAKTLQNVQKPPFLSECHRF